MKSDKQDQQPVWTAKEILKDFNFDAKQFESESTPYLALFSLYGTDPKDSRFVKAKNVLKKYAKSMVNVSAKTFDEMLKSELANWKEQQKKDEKKNGVEVVTNNEISMTQFGPDDPASVCCGHWKTDRGYVYQIGPKEQVIVACPHPILPVRILKNVDTGDEKVEIYFKKSTKGKYQSIIVDRNVIASNMKIVELSKSGVNVISDTARFLVNYFYECLAYGQDQIETVESISRLGYIKDYGFSPYYKGLVFDGENAYRKIFNAVKSNGDYEVWRDHVREIRKIVRDKYDNPVNKAKLGARLVIDASFASVILEKLGDLSFFVHLWGVESGTGKTVALMAAASVWADPNPGVYIQTFNSTSVGLERYAAFFGNLPMIIDETQLAKRKGGIDLSTKIYELTQGTGRTRGTKDGVAYTASWRLCFISSGETPIVQENDGAGAHNRAFEIETESGNPIIEDGHLTAEIVRENYGHAGREWIDIIDRNDDSIIERMKVAYSSAYQYFLDQGITGKQAMAGAVLFATDIAVSGYIFHDYEPGNCLTWDDIIGFMKKSETVDINQRAYAFLVDWIAQNSQRFQDPHGISASSGDVYGRSTGRSTIIINSVFVKVMSENGFNGKALKEWLRARGLIVLGSKGETTCRHYTFAGERPYSIEILNEPDPK